MESWTPVEGQTLTLRPEPDNVYDRFAVLALEGENIVGRVPKEISKIINAACMEAPIHSEVLSDKKVQSQNNKRLEIMLKVVIDGQSSVLRKAFNALKKKNSIVFNTNLTN